LKIAYDTKSYAPKPPPLPPVAPEPENTGFTVFEEEPAATLELSETSRAGKSAMDAKAPGPKDASGRLTRRLVAAGFQGEVRSIITEAYENMSDWLKAAMGGGEDARKAFAAIRRLNKLIQRAQRKIGDLDREDLLRLKRERAEQKQESLRAKQIEQELKRRIEERRMRERRYLQEIRPEKEGQGKPDPGLSPAALQAKITALAATLSQLSAAPPPAPSGGDVSIVSSGGETVPAAAAAVPAAEVAAEA
jgi:hypothetical protein